MKYEKPNILTIKNNKKPKCYIHKYYKLEKGIDILYKKKNKIT